MNLFIVQYRDKTNCKVSYALIHCTEFIPNVTQNMDLIAEYRAIHGVDTLAASSHLRRLRDIGLLEQKGRGNAAFYVPTKQLLAPGISPSTPGIGLLTLGISPSDLSIPAPVPQNFPPIPNTSMAELQGIGKRTPNAKAKRAFNFKPRTFEWL